MSTKKFRTMRACMECGKAFYGSGDYHYCPECAKKRKLDTVVRIRTCTDCGVEFYGGPRARRCPPCAREAIKEMDRKRKREGTKRPIGSIDKCIKCGKEYIVRGGRQKYCQECKEEANLEWQRGHKKEYAKKSGQQEKKNVRRKQQEKVCVYCLKRFKSSTNTNVCSGYCRKEQTKINQCMADIKRGSNRNLDKYIEKRDEYREKIASKEDEYNSNQEEK